MNRYIVISYLVYSDCPVRVDIFGLCSYPNTSIRIRICQLDTPAPPLVTILRQSTNYDKLDLLCTSRRSSLYIWTAQSELTYLDFVPIRIYIFGSELVNLDLAVRVDIFGSDLIESDVWYIRTDTYTLIYFLQLRILTSI
jgi:hypothetical protein